MKTIKQVADVVVSIATLILLAYVALAVYNRPVAQPRPPAGPVAGDAIPAVMLEGNPDVIAIISPTCPYCERSVPEWNKLADAGVNVLAFSLADPTSFVATTTPTFPVTFLEGKDSAAFSQLGVSVVPLTIVVGGDSIEFVHRGLVRDAETEIPRRFDSIAVTGLDAHPITGEKGR